MQRGICKLCQQDRDLQESHLIPAAVYKRFHSLASPNPNPLFISSRGVIQTSRQTKTRLLCAECEDILNREGEKWVLPLIANEDKTFPLYEILTRVAPDCTLPNITAYAAIRNPGIKIKELTHFAAGIFWKASVHSWRSGKNETQIELGPYEERLRSYVLEPQKAPFPENVTLMITLLPPSNVPLMTNIPMRGPSGEGFRNFRFYMPGIQFILSVGKGVECETCFQTNPLHPICVSDIRRDIERGPRALIRKAKDAKAGTQTRSPNP